MKTNKAKSYKWVYLPFVFSSAAIVASTATAGPGSQQYQDAKQVNSVNHEYVGGGTQLGVSVTDDGDVGLELNQVISEDANSSTSVGLWGDYDLDGDNDGLQGRGAKVNHAWVSRNNAGQATHVNKVMAAYDRNASGHDKATIGYGQENENTFWDVHASKGLSGKKSLGNGTSEQAYDYGVGAGVGTFLKGSNVRVRAGLDHEWGDDVGAGESTAKNTTLSAGIEKFFQGTPHSLGLDVAASKKSGGLESASDDTDVNGRLTYRYDFGGASIYQPDRRYKRVRVEVPGKAVPPRYAQKQTFKRVPTYKSVPTYAKKTVKKPYKQLVKSTMALEGQTFFKLNSYKLIPSAQARLKQIATEIRKNGYKGSIRITGNTCGLGNAAYDQKLSEQRAREVRKFLIKHGFNPDHLVARGLGKGHPKYPNTPEQGFKNRRVDIEYVSERKAYKTGYRTETQNVRTGTRQVATGFKNVPTGTKNVLVSSGKPGAPRVIWRTEVIPTSPAWIKRAMHNNIKHDRNVNTYISTDKVVNAAPVANNDSSNVVCGTSPVTINVIGNDSDPENDALTVTGTTNGQYGTTAIVGNQVVYTPNGTGCGQTDSFEYTITDGNGNTSTATVNVDIAAANTAPTAVNDADTTPLNTPVTISVLGNDTDPEGDTLSVTSYSQGGSGTVTEDANGNLVYTPNAGFVGTDSFTYAITDGNGGVDSATVTVTVEGPVNTAPIANNDTQNILCTTAPVTINVIGNDTDPEGDNLTVTGTTNGQYGTTEIVGNQVVYTPNGTGCGLVDSFEYTISDGNGGTSTATVTVNAEAANTAPTAVNDADTTPLNTPVTIAVIGNDTDPEGDTLTVTTFSQGANGSVAKDANGNLVYTPTADFVGTDSFTYEITDGNGGIDSATVNVTVTSNGSAPNAVNDVDSTPLNTPVSINVVANDTDPENDILSVTSFTQGSNGVVSQDGNGTLVYTPNADFVGTDSFTYEITDGNGGIDSATVTVTVEGPANTAPIARNDTRNIICTTAPAVLNVISNDSDPENDTLTITEVTNGQYGSTTIVGNRVVYTPNGNGCGQTDSFEYTISDGNGGTSTATVTVNAEAANTAPNAVNDVDTTPLNTPVTISVLGNDTDPEGDTLTVTTFTQGANGSVSKDANGNLVYTPNTGFVGMDSFTYAITDGNGGTDTATVKVTVEGPVNTAPNAVDDSDTTSVNTPVTIAVIGNDTDPEGDTLTVTSFTQGANGSVSKDANGNLVYTPNTGFVGTDNFTYVISDGNGGVDTAMVTVKVKGNGTCNVVCTVAESDDASTIVGVPVTIDVLANDTGKGLSIVALDNPHHGTAKIVGNSIKYTPKPGFTGIDSFWYGIKDSSGYETSALVEVYVNETTGCSTGCEPEPISVKDDSASTKQGTGIMINVLANDDQGLKITNVSNSNNSYTEIVNGKVSYLPNDDFYGFDSFTYTVKDDHGQTATATVTVKVEKSAPKPNRDPDAIEDSYIVNVGESATFDVLVNDIDPDGDKITLDSVAQSRPGAKVSLRNGKIHFVSNGVIGSYSFNYKVTDGRGGKDYASVTVGVVDPNGGNENYPDITNEEVTTKMGKPITIDVLANDFDADGDTLVLDGLSGGYNGTKSKVNGKIYYVPNPNFVGTDTIWYGVHDGRGHSNSGKVTINVID